MKNEIFKPTIDKDINNNENVFYSRNDEDLDKFDGRTESLDDFLNRISSSGSYIFSHNVIIETKNKVYKTKIAGKVGNNIITMDDEVISISDIVSVKEI